MADIYNFDTRLDDDASVLSEVIALRRELNRLKADNETLKEKVSDLTGKVYFHEGARQALPFLMIVCMLGAVFLSAQIIPDLINR